VIFTNKFSKCWQELVNIELPLNWCIHVFMLGVFEVLSLRITDELLGQQFAVAFVVEVALRWTFVVRSYDVKALDLSFS